MSHFGASLVALLALAGTAFAQSAVTKTLWNCKDASGRVTITSEKSDTAGKDCRIVHEERVSVVPAPASKERSATRTPTPASFPKETAADRAASRAKQRDTIEKELSQEELLLGEAKRRLSEQESVRGGDEKNYARVLERLQPYRDAVEVHSKNVDALKRELSNLSR